MIYYVSVFYNVTVSTEKNAWGIDRIENVSVFIGEKKSVAGYKLHFPGHRLELKLNYAHPETVARFSGEYFTAIFRRSEIYNYVRIVSCYIVVRRYNNNAIVWAHRSSFRSLPPGGERRNSNYTDG